jgi:hypothetical protein
MFSILFAFINYRIRRFRDDDPEEHVISEDERKDY